MDGSGSEVASFRCWKLFFFSFFWISDYLLRLIEVQFVVLRLFSGGPDRTHYAAVGNLQDHVASQTQKPASFNHGVANIEPDSHVRIGQNRTVFDHRTVIHVAVFLNV